MTAAQKTGGPLPPPPPPAANPDYVQCPHCSRRFNEHAAERHIPFCKEQKSRLSNTLSAKASSASMAKRKQVRYYCRTCNTVCRAIVVGQTLG